jgi:alpha-mannosidase
MVTMKHMTIGLRVAIRSSLLLAIISLGLPAFGQDRTVWKIGSFDRSSGEFRNHDVNYADPKTDPTFVVGKSKDAEWYRFQPGPANGITGGRVHPFTLKFTLSEPPRGVYYLKIGMLYETPRLSFLKLSANGHSGNFYFHPKLDFNAGDWEGTFVPQTSYDEKTIAIPAAFLKSGENVFVFTAIDDPATSQTALGAIAPGQTGLVYDALELRQNASARYDDKSINALVVPSIFYKQSAKGLAEVVDVYVGAAKWVKNPSAQLSIAGRNLEKQVMSDNDFGEQRFVFEVPEWSGESQASVRVGGQTTKATKVAPAKKWNIAIIPHEHLDVGFTDYPAKVAELHSQSIDAAMELIKKTPDFRWTLDGSWVAEQYLNARSPEAQQRFIEHAKNGSIVIPPEYSNQHTGNASWEALARSFYHRRQLEKRFNLERSDAAQIVDVPSYTWGYASVLHDAGIKYLVAASNSWRAPVMLHGRWNEKSPFYWEGPDGSRVLMWYSRAYLQGHTLFGGPWSMEAVRDALPVFLQAYTRPDYTANTAIIFGTQLENTPLAKEQSEIVARFSSEYTWPKVEYSTVSAAMHRIETEWKGQFPVYRGDFGPYWEDGYGAQAQFTAIHRENQHRIGTAEIMGAAASSIDPLVRTDRTLLQDAWRNELVFDEHTWTYVGATTQPEHRQTEYQTALKAARVLRAQNDISESIHRGWAQLQAYVKPKDSSVAVFNSLNWARSGIVETDIPDGNKLVDASNGKDVPFEILFKGRGISLPGFGPGSVRIRFVASSVPPVGYKLYSVKPATASDAVASEIRGNVIENEFYRITVDPPSGAIASIFDKQLGRELVDTKSPYKFGSYLYVTGGDDYPKNSLYRFGAGLKPPALTVSPASSGNVVSAKTTPIGSIITLTAAATNTPTITTEILLLNSEKKILITYHLTKQRVLTRESAYIAFPFAVSQPAFTYGSQSAWVDPSKNELAGGSREWYLPTTWASVHDQQWTAAVVPIDAPLVSFGDIVRAEWPTEFKPRTSTIFSWLMNNYWGTNFPAWQGGEFTFRYAITSNAKFDPAGLTRFGWNALAPLERDDVAGTKEQSLLPQTEASLLDIDNPNVTLLTWKEAEDSDGTILRIQESSGLASDVTMRSKFLSVKQAWLCDALEDKQSELKVDGDGIAVPIKPFQTLTIRLKTVPRTAGGNGQ